MCQGRAPDTGAGPSNFASVFSNKNAEIFKNVYFDETADEVVPTSTFLPFHEVTTAPVVHERYLVRMNIISFVVPSKNFWSPIFEDNGGEVNWEAGGTKRIGSNIFCRPTHFSFWLGLHSAGPSVTTIIFELSRRENMRF